MEAPAEALSDMADGPLPDMPDGLMRLSGVAPQPGYGYTPDLPVRLGGVMDGSFEDRLDDYFALLRAANGDRLVFILSNTCCSFETPNNPNGGFLQVYEVGIEGGKPVHLYINGYDEDTVYVPHGMLAAHSAAALERIEEAYGDIEIRNYETAIDKLAPLAEEGDMMAKYYLARTYADLENYEAAYPWFLQAAEAGHNISQATVSNMLEQGKGVAPNPALAQEWLRRAARNGHAGSRMTLALRLLSGPVDQQRSQEGAQLLHMAAEQGDPAAQAAYGLMLAFGRGIRQDIYQGMMWLYLAQRAGNKNASELYPKLAEEQTGSMLERVRLAAEDWLSRTGPPPVVPEDQIPNFY